MAAYDGPLAGQNVEYDEVSPLAAHRIEESKKEGDARRTIASRLVWAYLTLLFLTLVVPVLLYVAAPTPAGSQLNAIKDLATPLTAGLSSVTGVVGFVLGYYFKTEERRVGEEP